MGIGLGGLFVTVVLAVANPAPGNDAAICHRLEPLSEPSASAWLAANSGTLRFQPDDYYRYRTGGIEVRSDAGSCGADVGVCATSIRLSPDGRFVILVATAGDGSLPSEILVIRKSDKVVWRASVPDQKLDVGRPTAGYQAFVGWPAWNSATGVGYVRCAPNGRYDLVMTVGVSRTVELPTWLIKDKAPPSITIAPSTLASLPAFLTSEFPDSFRWSGIQSIAFDPLSGVVYFSNGTKSGSFGSDGSATPWFFKRPDGPPQGLAAYTVPYTIAASAIALIATTPPHNVFEKSDLYSVPFTSGAVSMLTSYDWNPVGLAVDRGQGRVFAADPYANIVYRVSAGKPAIFAGRCENLVDGTINDADPQMCQGGDVDGASSVARFNQPNGLAYDAEDDVLFVADTGNNEIRGIHRDGTVFTLAGSCERLEGYPDCVGRLLDGNAKNARFDYPMSIAYDSKHHMLYVADEFNHAVRSVSLDGDVNTLAGNGSCGLKDGVGSAASFCYPTALAFDPKSDSIFVIDGGNNALRRMSLDGGVATVANVLF
ncbi:MAG TPA: hypothetical protein VKT51_10535 [Candidatus Eremiobacteraceae bacterium]|nr:hypothetical protein [Candidatus Eremiobacteraceae bacterium]